MARVLAATPSQRPDPMPARMGRAEEESAGRRCRHVLVHRFLLTALEEARWSCLGGSEPAVDTGVVDSGPTRVLAAGEPLIAGSDKDVFGARSGAHQQTWLRTTPGRNQRQMTLMPLVH